MEQRVPKRPMTLNVRIPEYTPPRTRWRVAVHRAVSEVQRARAVHYEPTDRLEVQLRLYFTDRGAARIHDVDNRLKDCLDALQGRVGGTKSKAQRLLPPLIPNDRQVWRVVVQKGLAPKQARARGHLIVRRLSVP
jgi:hypothetical protein